MKELAKTYNPKEIEQSIYDNWLKQKYFHAACAGKADCIMIRKADRKHTAHRNSFSLFRFFILHYLALRLAVTIFYDRKLSYLRLKISTLILLYII